MVFVVPLTLKAQVWRPTLAKRIFKTSLRITVHQQDFFTGSRETDAEICHHSGFVRSAFLIAAAVNFTHSYDPPSWLVCSAAHSCMIFRTPFFIISGVQSSGK